MVLPLILPVPATAAVPAVDLTVESSTHATSAHGQHQHTVRDGETIYDIAARHRVSPDALLARNNLASSDFIHPGQQLSLPGRSAVGSSPSSSQRPARAGATRTYVVRSGDTLSGIAARHRMSVERLRSLNEVSGDHIRPGERLRVTGSAAKPAKRATTHRLAAGSTHTVRSGDTLSGIASRHGMSPTRLAKLNGISSADVLHPGDHLRVSAAAGSARSGGNSFAGRTYSGTIVSAADRNREALAARSVPTREQTKQRIIRISRQHGLDPTLALAISYQESGWDQRRVSVANAVGAMQIIPSSGEWTSQMVGRQLDLLDTDDNITAGVLLLKTLTQQASSTDDAIAGYYQGLASVNRNGMYSDTTSYVANVKALRSRM